MKRKNLKKIQFKSEENGLPVGWEWSRLGDCVQFLDSQRVPLNSTERAKRTGSYPYYGANGKVDSIDDYIYDEPLTLLAEDGGFFDNPLRGVAYCVDGKCWVNNHAHVLKPLGGISNKYIRNALNITDLMPFVSGTTRLKLNQGAAQKVNIALAPLTEQNRILNKLETLFSRIEKSNTSIEKVPGMLMQFRQAVLAAACSGKLAEQDRNDEPVSVLLERNRALRKKKWYDELIVKGKDPKGIAYKEPVEVDILELLELPKGWAWVHLPELGLLSRGMSKHRPRNEKRLYGGKYPFIQTGDIRNSPDIILKYTQTYNEEGLKQSKQWPKNTLAITIAANIAETAILGFSACFPDSVVGLIADENLCDIHYVHYFIRTIKSRLSSFASATAQKNLNIRTLNKVAVALPPLNEQKRIVARVQELFKFADAIEASVTKAQGNADRIKQALLAKAFRGELVEQDPNDEPASVLLRRIKENRSASAKVKS